MFTIDKQWAGQGLSNQADDGINCKRRGGNFSVLQTVESRGRRRVTIPKLAQSTKFAVDTNGKGFVVDLVGGTHAVS